MLFGRRNNNDEVKSTVQSVVNPSGIIKYNVVYIPRFNGYRITLVSKSGTIDASYIAEIIGKLTEKGYTVLLKSPHSMFGRGGVVVLYAEKGSSK